MDFLLDTVSDGSPSSMQQRPKALVSLISLHLIARLLHLVLQEGQVGVQVGVQGIAHSLVAQSCQAHNSPCIVAEDALECTVVGGEGFLRLLKGRPEWVVRGLPV